MMKLTQKTIFQCFDKSQKQSPIVINEKDDDIIECDVELEPSLSIEQPESQTDFLLPVHVRQDDTSSQDEIIPLISRWKVEEVDDDDSISLHHSNDFYRICPFNNPDQIASPRVQFKHIPSRDRQMELFQQYTNDELSSYAQSTIDWQTMFQYLQDYRTKAIEQNQYEQLPWTEVYRARHTKTYLGSHTKQIRRLNEWFKHWTKKLHNEKPKKITCKGRKRTRGYEDNSDEDFIDESNMIYYNRCRSKQEHPQLIFIHGCGTTSLVHALAEEHHFKVTEINGTQSRARAPLLKQLEQVTSHHYLSLKRCASDTILPSEDPMKLNTSLPVKKKAKNERGTIMSFFNSKKTDEHKETNTRRRSDSTNKANTVTTRRTKKQEEEKQQRPPVPTDPSLLSSVHVEKSSLILFDEIETLTADDNFWSCLKKLLETAKKPIILTSNSRSNPEDVIFNLSKIGDYEMIHLEPSEPELVFCFLRLILLVETLEIPVLNDLVALFQSCSCDLRQSLLTLQFLAQSSSIACTDHISTERTEEKSKLQSSRLFDTMYYSYLAEQWDESILKAPFDDLTRKYTCEYEQSRLLLVNHCKNDSKRIELYDTFKMFMQEQNTENLINRSAFYLDYRPYIRQMCQNEQTRAAESTSTRRLRHCLSFRGCSLQWSDFATLSSGLD
ncbi:unnamed protein product [Adineta ricciae]|uniref:ATPase AAA-type core domain-containing protein n=2 Tax=Adineta ricciae TaxID=249248 RepID=A0A814MSW7_ADIRI|nr:unnamed protein product [Adineta ricciae]